MHVGPVLAENGVLAASPGLVDLQKQTPESPTAPLEEIPQATQAMEVTETGRPRRQCRQNISYTDNDIDVILEQHLLDNGRTRKRKDVNENEPVQKKRGRTKKSDSGAVTPKTSTSKTKTDENSSQNNSMAMVKQGSVNGPSTSSANSGHVINEQQRQALIASIKHVEYELKFMDVDRLHFEMQTRDEAHLNPDFRRTLVDDWVSTSYDHEFHLGRLMELARNPNQQHTDTILHTIFVMRGLLNVKNENNLLKLKMEELVRQQKNGSNGSV
ncbi:unnamed protein product [Bursaphelenchus xylophilus]|uniref:(pine wood nematode) hypothetical protein n=1 Tax=Bursaphelenchus xylophilus TaxID=6326 RepID=A0A1I7S267_BURXY|nr:unnamed protein product [Bursaphelenchus xylophilus]CAG9114859.1 unnamed protein product [Bursaphelenchus xylophilus]